MLHTRKPSRKVKAPPPPLAESTIVERPDGYYWQSEDGRQDFGPFESYEQALADRDAASEEALAPTSTLHESEEAIGMSNWIDPETGEPAEGESPPRLAEE